MRSAARLWAIVVPAGLAVGAGALALALTSDHSNDSSPNLVLAMLVGFAFIFAGLVARTRRPENRTGLLLIGVGFAWFFNGLSFADNSYVWTAGFSLSAIWAAVFVHTLLAYPSGRLGAPWQRAVVAGGYTLAVLANIAAALFEPDPARCSDCPANRLLISDNHGAAIAIMTLVQVLAAAYLISMGSRCTCAGAGRPGRPAAARPGAAGRRRQPRALRSLARARSDLEACVRRRERPGGARVPHGAVPLPVRAHAHAAGPGRRWQAAGRDVTRRLADGGAGEPAPNAPRPDARARVLARRAPRVRRRRRSPYDLPHEVRPGR